MVPSSPSIRRGGTSQLQSISPIPASRIPLKKKLEAYLKTHGAGSSQRTSPSNAASGELSVNLGKPPDPVNFAHPLEGGLGAIPLGSPVITLKERRTGRLRYLGNIKLKEGVWAGVELDERGMGKNDGSVGGERYFTCHPNTGIFIDPRALPTQLSARYRRTPNFNQPSKIPILSSRSVRRELGTSPKLNALAGANPLQKQPMGALNASLKLNDRIEAHPDTLNQVKRELPRSIAPLKIPSYKSPLRALVSEPRSKFEPDGLDANTLNYLASADANPAVIIQNLLSQLHASKKQNELLQVRLNKKRATTEAARMIRSELLGRACNGAPVPIRPPNEAPAGESVKLLESERLIQELNRRMNRKDSELQELRSKLLDGGGASLASRGETLAGSPSKEDGAQALLMELRSLQTQLRTQEEIILLIQEDVYAEGNQLNLPARVKQAFAELKTLKGNSSRDLLDLELQIGRLNGSRTEQNVSQDPHASNHQSEIASLKARLEDEIRRREHAENILREITQKPGQETSPPKQRHEQLTEGSCRLKAQLGVRDPRSEGSGPEDKALPSQLQNLLQTVEALKAEKAELQNLLETFRSQGDAYRADQIPLELYEELKEEKNQYLSVIEELQREREAMRKPIDPSLGSAHPLDSGAASLEKDSQVLGLEERIRNLEDELILCKAFVEKVHSGTLTQDDVHKSLAQELQLRNRDILQLETKASAAEARARHLKEANGQLLTDMQTLENDNWELNDVIKELQDEAAIASEQERFHKARAAQLEQALDSLASTSDSASKLQEVLLRCEQAETTHRAELATLYRMIDEQDEELAQMAEREAEMHERISNLERQLELTSPTNSLLAPSLKGDPNHVGHLGYEAGQGLNACPHPISPSGLDEAALAQLEVATAELDTELHLAGRDRSSLPT
ncbi:Kinesin-like protein kif13b [Massospora cicadina]|nr:Kinesin-like protein kif13b [Massospora cicadina]